MAGKTQTSVREKSSQAQAQAQAQQAQDIAAAVATEEIEKGARVYVDITARVPTPDGSLASVQREQRADGSLGEYQLAEIRASKQKGQPENVTRHSLARVQMLKDVLYGAGIKVIR